MQQTFLLQILLLAQHVSGTTMPIIRSSRVLNSGCCLWYFVLWFSSCWSGVELRVMCSVCRMLAGLLGNKMSTRCVSVCIGDRGSAQGAARGISLLNSHISCVTLAPTTRNSALCLHIKGLTTRILFSERWEPYFLCIISMDFLLH